LNHSVYNQRFLTSVKSPGENRLLSSMDVVEQSECSPLSSSWWLFNCWTSDLSCRYTDMHSWLRVGSEMSISARSDRWSP